MSTRLALTAENGPFEIQGPERPYRATELVNPGQASFKGVLPVVNNKEQISISPKSKHFQIDVTLRVFGVG